MIDYEETEWFKKDLKRLARRFPSLPGDLETAKRAAIELRHIRDLDNQSTFEIPGCANGVESCWKVRKFACRSLKGRGNQSGIRIIYSWCQSHRRVVFIEIYLKSEQGKENRERILRYLSGKE